MKTLHERSNPDESNVFGRDSLFSYVMVENQDGKGEDSAFFLHIDDRTLLAVLDGLGGHSAGYDGQKGGRIASRLSSALGIKHFKQYEGETNQNVVDEFVHASQALLFEDAERYIRPSKIRSKSFSQRLCTTIALASIQHPSLESKSFTVDIAWLGDSRLYFLSPEKGLQQLSVDDIVIQTDGSLDLEIIQGGHPMKQYISADMNPEWKANYRSFSFEEPGIVCAATDGAFEYFRGPWNLELTLLRTLVNVDRITEWTYSLRDTFKSVAGDDVTFLAQPVGFENFDQVRLAYSDRLSLLTNLITEASSTENPIDETWGRYAPDYLAYIQSYKSKPMSSEED